MRNAQLRWIALGLALGLVGAFVGTAGLAHGEGPTIDGVISDGEYQYCVSVDEIQMDVCWYISDEDFYVAVKAPAQGWVGFGLRPGVPPEETEKGMEGVDILIGYVQDGQTFYRDDWAHTPFSHKADTELGGAENIEKAAGTEEGGFTVIEFERLLNTQDAYDADIPVRGEVYLAYSDADDFVSMHKADKEVVINFVTGAVEEEEHEE